MPDKVATFSLKLDSNASDVAREDSAELAALRDKIRGSSDALKQMGAAYRSLRGKTDEVTSAKSQLKAMIDAERDAMSAANLAILKQGSTYEKLADQARKVAKAKEKLDAHKEAEGLARLRVAGDKLREGVEKAGGPVAELAGKFRSLAGLAGGAGGGIGLAGLAAAAAVGAFVALSAAIVAGVVALGRWIIEGANAERTLGLMREAATGSAEGAANLGDQIELLAHKVATPKAKLEALALTLTKTLSSSQVSGQGIVDTFNAVAQASEAMGDDVGAQLGEIITRAKRFGRVQISPYEITGSGPKFHDIARELATQMHVGIAEAQMALMQGRVKVDDAAKAIRTTVEKRFGEINARKILAIDVQMQKFHENLDKLRSGVNLEPLLKGVASILSLFDTSTVAGAALRDTITTIGNVIGVVFTGAVPDIKSFVKAMIIGALDVVIAALKISLALLQAKGTVHKFFSAFGGLATIKNAMVLLTAVVAGLAAAFVALSFSTILIWGPFAFIALAVGALVIILWDLVDAWDSVVAWAKNAGAAMDDFGKSIIDGIIRGISKAWHLVVDKIKSLAGFIKKAFTGELEIGSPSKVFARYGEALPEGAAIGIARGAPDVQAAAEAMAPGAPGGAGGARAGGGAPIHVTVEINVGGGGRGQETAKALSEPSFLAGLVDAVEAGLRAAGIPTQGATV